MHLKNLFCISLMIMATGCNSCQGESQYTPYQKEPVETNSPEDREKNPIYQDMRKKFLASCKDETDSLIEVEELLKLQSSQNLSDAGFKNLVLIDQREDSEQLVSIIPGAVLDKNFDVSTASKETLYVVYCTIGCRSGSMTQSLIEKGLNAKNLVGGVLAWSWFNESFVDLQGNTTKRVHTYDSSWNFLNPNYEAIY